MDSFSLTLGLYDNGDSNSEWAIVNVPGLLGDRFFFDLSGQEFGGWSLAGWLDLNNKGTYSFSVYSAMGERHRLHVRLVDASTRTAGTERRRPGGGPRTSFARATRDWPDWHGCGAVSSSQPETKITKKKRIPGVSY